MELPFLHEYGLFFLKTITFIVAIIIVVGVIGSLSMKHKSDEGGEIDVKKINDQFDDMRYAVERVVMNEETVKQEIKERKKQEKKEKKAAKKKIKLSNQEAYSEKKRVFLIDFIGDMKASAVSQLREVVTAILFVANKNDEVVVRLESSGGMVHSYGLAASQLDRIRQKDIPLTVCVDKVAASGGYMMACVANKVIAAPFSVIGSIGVVAQLPNFHKLLKKNDIDFEQLTAGEHKRTLTMFGENTDKARKKFMEDLELTHSLFKDYVHKQRKIVDIDEVATGEVWLGTTALEKKLVDELTTSDDYLSQLVVDNNIYQVSYSTKKNVLEKLGFAVQNGIENAVSRIIEQLQWARYFH